MIGQTISHYRILEKIGEGGMGAVYLAEDTELQRRVAIKFLPATGASDPDALARFKREARAAASLSHSNIITIYDVSEHEGQPYIVMAYVEGKPLSAVIKSGPIPLDKVLDYATQITEGLSKAHQAGVIHRDLKPDNILIDAEGNIKILDFGLAKVGGVTKLTNEASTLGTIYYMSPEQARTSDVDHRSDIFSLGTILYEMITGRLPFQGDHPGAVTYSIMTEEPQPLGRFTNEASPELQRIVSKALAKDPGERYQSCADLAADLRRERRLSLTGMSAASMPVASPAPRRRRTLRFVIPASIVGVAAALILIFKPFKFEIAPDQPVVAAQNMLAIMYFDNKVDRDDEERLGEIMTDLLITDLSESAALHVLSSQRLYDLLKLEGKEGVKSLDQATSTNVAKSAGAKLMLMGSILRVEPEMIVTAQVVDVESGAVVSSQRVKGASGDDVFEVADKLSNEIRSDMALPAGVATSDEHAIKASTQSAVAYRYYLEGREYANRVYYEDARQSYLKAVREDSTFAMAYYQLSLNVPPAVALPFIEKARQYASNVTEQESLWIDARYADLHDDTESALDLMKRITEQYPEDKEAYFRLGRYYHARLHDPNEAIRYYQKAIDIDPLYKLTYNNLAYACARIGDLDQSIWAINKYIELAPDEPNPYDTRGDLYAWSGKVDEAIESYKKAVAIEPDFEMSIIKLGHMYRAKRDYTAAEATYRQLLDSDEPSRRSYARGYLAGLLAYQGKFDFALQQYDQGIAADRLENNVDDWHYYDKFVLKGQIYELRGELDKSLAVMEELHDELGADEVVTSASVCEWSALAGESDRAERIAAILKGRSDDEDFDYPFCIAAIAFASGRYDEAVKQYEKLSHSDRSIWNIFRLARAYQEANRLSEAVQAYETILARYSNSWGDDPTTAVTVHYYAGLAYEKSGWNDKAIEHYEEFLTIWKDADPGIDLVDDAKQRLERLHQGS